MQRRLDCPYCGEAFATVLVPEDGSQHCIEDCPVCCRPIELHIECDASGNIVSVTAMRDDE